MTYCQNCGSTLTDTQEFCTNCGTRRAGLGTAPTVPGPTPPPDYAPPYVPPQRGSGIIVVVILLVVMLVIGIVAAAVLLYLPSGSEGEGVTIDSVTVDDRPLGAEADQGNRIVNLLLTMTNHGSGEVPLDPSDFELEVSEGERYPTTDKVSSSMPDRLAPGATESFTLAFEVPEDAEPFILHYDSSFA